MATCKRELAAALRAGEKVDVKATNRKDWLLECLVNGECPEIEPKTEVEDFILALCEKGGSGGYPYSMEWIKAVGQEGKTEKFLIADGAIITGGNGKIWVSQNGIEWNQVETETPVNSNIQYGNGVFVSPGGNRNLMYSEDLETWNDTNATYGSMSTTQVWTIKYANGVWVATSFGIWHSEDGVTWEQDEATSNRGGEWTLSHNNGLWHASVGKDMWCSEDGKNWEHLGSDYGYASLPIVYASGVYVRMDRSGVWYSEDGKTWVKSNVTGQYFHRATYTNGLWHVMADTYGDPLYYSEDGKTWHESNIKEGNPTGVIYANGLWFTIAAGKAWFSEDGKTWTQAGAIECNANNILYSYGTFLAISAGTFAHSADGKAWSSSGFSFDYGNPDVIFRDGVWIASTPNGVYYCIPWEP